MAQKIIGVSAEDMLPLDEEEVDAIKSFVVRSLLKHTSLDREDIYSFIYGEGRRILWN